MKYSAPYGVSDPNAHYVNGNPQTGVQGSIPPASAFEEPQRELVNFILQSNINPDEGDLYQITKAIRSQFVNVTRDVSTTTNSIVCALQPPLQTYTLGLPLQVIVARTNTGNVTINAGPGIVQVVRNDGSALQAADMTAGGIATLIFDGTRFQMMNFLGAVSGGSATFEVNIPYIADTSPISNAVTAVFSPAIESVVPGDVVLVKLANPITGATTITVNALPVAQITKVDQSPLSSGDAAVGQVMLLIWDGFRWQLSNARYATLATGLQIYDTAGVFTFTVPANVYRLTRVKLWGGGGGGGAGYPYGPTGVTGGGGGGAGGFAEFRGFNVTPGQVITVTIGTGGIGTPTFNWSTGATGGTSSFGAYLSATGGLGGTSGYPSSLGVGGLNGVGTGGHINYRGARGFTALLATPAASYSAGGHGGASAEIGITQTGGYGYAVATEHPGAGGNGGASWMSGGAYSSGGATGGVGRCEIEWRI